MRAVLRALLPLMVAVASSATSAAEVALRVDGLTCPFCAYGLEKKLAALSSVAAVEIDLEEGRARLRLEPGEPLDVAALEQAVRKSGFRLRAVELRGAEGRLESEPEGAFRLELEDPPARFRVGAWELGARADGSAPPSGSRVRVDGQVEAFEAQPPELHITSLELLVGPPGIPTH